MVICLLPLFKKSCGISSRSLVEKSLLKQEHHMQVCQGPWFYLKLLVEKGRTQKTIAFIVDPLSCNCTLSQYSKFGFDTFSAFWVMGYDDNVEDDNNDNDDDHNNSTLSSKQTSQ